MQPDMIASAVHALHLLLEPMRLLFLCVGVIIGLAIGVLTGVSPRELLDLHADVVLESIAELETALDERG